MKINEVLDHPELKKKREQSKDAKRNSLRTTKKVSGFVSRGVDGRPIH
jgi:hypothetical protein